MLEIWTLLTALGGAAGIAAIVRQVRLYLRDCGDRKFARYVFDQTRSTDGLDGYAGLIRARQMPLNALKKGPKSTETTDQGP